MCRFYQSLKHLPRDIERQLQGGSYLLNGNNKHIAWVKLKDLKEIYPVHIAEYTVQARISEELAFDGGIITLS